MQSISLRFFLYYRGIWNDMRKVLILSNPLNHEGGIVNYYNLFFDHYTSGKITVSHHVVGSRAEHFHRPTLKKIVYPLYLFLDIVKFLIRLIRDRDIAIVQVSPSLIPVPLLRDGVFVVLAKLFGKKVFVFYRGWKLPTFEVISNSWFYCKLFNLVFQRDTVQLVLSTAFKAQLESLRPKKSRPAIVTTTAIDSEKIIMGPRRGQDERTKVLFLGRIQNLKGVEEIVTAICKLHERKELKQFHFQFVGHEAETGYIEKLAAQLRNCCIPEDAYEFSGRLTGRSKYLAYADNDVFLLPSYSEGCPNSVLEAMAAGLFCITTSVGALGDIIKPGESGEFVAIGDSDAIVEALIAHRPCLVDHSLISRYAISKFDIRPVVTMFEELYIEATN